MKKEVEMRSNKRGFNKLTKIFSLDFLGSNYYYYRKYKFAMIQLWALQDYQNEDNSFYGSDIKSLFENLKTKALTNSIIYVYNLNYLSSFLFWYLLKNNFNYINGKINSKSNKGFNALISETGIVYNVKISFNNHLFVEFRSLKNLVPYSLEKLNIDFDCEEDLSIYSPEEEDDIIDFKYTQNKLEWLFSRCRIINKVLSFFFRADLNFLTISSASYHSLISTCPNFSTYYPKLNEDWLLEWRLAYRGGRTQIRQGLENRILLDIHRYDFNSMYPYIMKNYRLPYGEPIKIKKVNSFEFELYKVEIQIGIKKGHLPCILKKDPKNTSLDILGESYITSMEEIEIIYITNYDLELIKKHYDIYYINFLEMYGFLTSKTDFSDYIEYWYKKKLEDKKENNKAKYLIDKLMLNTPSGKFGTILKQANLIPTLDINNKDYVQYIPTKEKLIGNYYLPLIIAITSIAHVLLDNIISKIGLKNFCYCDTDSIHCYCDLEKYFPELVDNEVLGKMKKEKSFKYVKYLKPKCYIYNEIDTEEVKAVISGVNGEELNKWIKEKQELYPKYKTLYPIACFKENVSIFNRILKEVEGGAVYERRVFKIF